jgi:thiol:disulfide interchange protein
VITRLAVVAGLALAGFGVWFWGANERVDHVTFLRFHPPFFAKALSAKKPVLVYFTSGGKAAEELENGVFKEQRVIDALDPLARFKLDMADADPVVEQLLAQTNPGSTPCFVFFSGDGTEVATVSGKLTADALVAAAGKATSATPRQAQRK